MNKRKRDLFFVFIISLASLLVGCSDESQQPAGVATSAATNAICEIWSQNPVVIRIDDEVLTKRDVLRNGKAMLLLNMNKMRHTRVGKQDREYLERYCLGTASREIGRAAARRYVKDKNLAPDTNVVAQLTKDFVVRYGVKPKGDKNWQTLDDLRSLLGEIAFRIDEELNDRAVYAAATNHILKTKPVAVTDEQIKEYYDGINAYNTRMLATNAVIYAQATNVWKAVVSQTNLFESLAKKYSEDRYIDKGCEWGFFTRRDLKDETVLLTLLPTLKVGDITPPIESDNGLAIIRLDAVDTAADAYTFSRIFFRLPLFFDHEPKDVVKSKLLRQQERERISEVFKEIADKMKIEYPNGKNVFSDGKRQFSITPEEFETCGNRESRCTNNKQGKNK